MVSKTIVVCFVSLLPLVANTPMTDRLEKSAKMFEQIMVVSERTIPQRLLDRAHCMVVVPDLKKGALLVGAKFGRGFVTCRRETAGWSAPAAVRIEGGSFGLQLGGSETDLIMLVMNERGVDRLMRSRFTLGGDASVAAGPVGRTASAETDAMMTAEILTWSRARGVFAGVSLQGATLRDDRAVNKEMYGEAWGTKDVVGSGLTPHSSGVRLVDLLNTYSARRTR